MRFSLNPFLSIIICIRVFGCGTFGRERGGGRRKKTESGKESRCYQLAFFILGFTVIFVLLGMFSGAVADFIKSAWVMRISGIVVVLMGLYIAGILNKLKIFSFLNRDVQFNLKNKPAGIIGSAVIGAILRVRGRPA